LSLTVVSFLALGLDDQAQQLRDQLPPLLDHLCR
jgi:hypothetical protein